MMIFRDLETHLKKSNIKDLQKKNKEYKNFKINKDSFNIMNNCLKDKYKPLNLNNKL